MSSLLRSNVTVAAGTAVSRITGLARVAVIGIVLSQGPVSDAYDQANGTPNMIYELLLGGVLSATLVPASAYGSYARPAELGSLGSTSSIFGGGACSCR